MKSKIAKPQEEEEELFEIESIAEERLKGGKLEYCIKWKGYDDKDNTWLPAAQLKQDMTAQSLKKLVTEYEARSKGAADKEARGGAEDKGKARSGRSQGPASLDAKGAAAAGAAEAEQGTAAVADDEAKIEEAVAMAAAAAADVSPPAPKRGRPAGKAAAASSSGKAPAPKRGRSSDAAAAAGMGSGASKRVKRAAKQEAPTRTTAATKKVAQSSKVAKTKTKGGAKLYRVEAIRARKGSGAKLSYLVKWEGYGEDDNTWLPAQQMKQDMTAASMRQLVEQFEGGHDDPAKPAKKAKKEAGKDRKKAAAPAEEPAEDSEETLDAEAQDEEEQEVDKSAKPVASSSDEDPGAMYKVEAIRAHKGSGKKLEYLVKWEGYEEDENTWLPALQLKEDMTGASFRDLVKAYKESQA